MSFKNKLNKVLNESYNIKDNPAIIELATKLLNTLHDNIMAEEKRIKNEYEVISYDVVSVEHNYDDIKSIIEAFRPAVAAAERSGLYVHVQYNNLTIVFIYSRKPFVEAKFDNPLDDMENGSDIDIFYGRKNAVVNTIMVLSDHWYSVKEIMDNMKRHSPEGPVMELMLLFDTNRTALQKFDPEGLSDQLRKLLLNAKSEDKNEL